MTVTLTPNAWLREAERCAKLARVYAIVEDAPGTARRYERIARDCKRHAARLTDMERPYHTT